MDVFLRDGFISDYDEYLLWVEEFASEASAKYLVKDEDEEVVSVSEAKIEKLISRSDFGSDEEYDDAVNDILCEGTYDVSAEFVTDNGIYYVGVSITGEEQPVESFDMNGVFYC